MTANIDGAATPRPELAAHIDAAASAWDSLAASGRRVAFEDTPDRPLQIRLRGDLDRDVASGPAQQPAERAGQRRQRVLGVR